MLSKFKSLLSRLSWEQRSSGTGRPSIVLDDYKNSEVPEASPHLANRPLTPLPPIPPTPRLEGLTELPPLNFYGHQQTNSQVPSTSAAQGVEEGASAIGIQSVAVFTVVESDHLSVSSQNTSNEIASEVPPLSLLPEIDSFEALSLSEDEEPSLGHETTVSITEISSDSCLEVDNHYNPHSPGSISPTSTAWDFSSSSDDSAMPSSNMMSNTNQDQEWWKATRTDKNTETTDLATPPVETATPIVPTGNITIEVSLEPATQAGLISFLVLQTSTSLGSFLKKNEQVMMLGHLIDDFRELLSGSEPYYTFSVGGSQPRRIPKDYTDLPLALSVKLLTANIQTLQATDRFADVEGSGVPVVGGIVDFSKAVKVMQELTYQHTDADMVSLFDASYRFVKVLGRRYFDRTVWEEKLSWMANKMLEERASMEQLLQQGSEPHRNVGGHAGKDRDEESKTKVGRYCRQMSSDIKYGPANQARGQGTDNVVARRHFTGSEAFDGGFQSSSHLEDRSKQTKKEPLSMAKRLMKKW